MRLGHLRVFTGADPEERHSSPVLLTGAQGAGRPPQAASRPPRTWAQGGFRADVGVSQPGPGPPGTPSGAQETHLKEGEGGTVAGFLE